MKLAQSVRLGALFLIVLNLVMAFGSIWVFMRMAPAIETIIDRNEKSLHACEEMLSVLATMNSSQKNHAESKEKFEIALGRATSNITEKEESIALDNVRKNYAQAFEANPEGIKQTVADILHLAEINRGAMVVADWKARQFVTAGAWGIVFMASVVFMIGMLFMQGMKRTLIRPLEEMHSVMLAIKNGDHIRRCTGPDAPRDIKVIYNGINELLDSNTSIYMNDKNWSK